MPLFKLQTATDPTSVPTASERFTRALVALTRTVWQATCTFDMAIGAICERAADALQVERVSVWHHDPDRGCLQCLHAFDALRGEHAPAEQIRHLTLEDDAYLAALEDLRTFQGEQVQADPPMPGQPSVLREYHLRHRIHAVLDAPAYITGVLHGVICHETTNAARCWTAEERTFAGSMGDYVAMAYEIARRRKAEAEVEHLRLHDGSTGLGNREYMLEVIRQRLDRPRLDEGALSLLHVLVEASGGIAWSAGAPTVEQVMAAIATRLRSFASDAIDLARVRENAFAFLLSGSARQYAAVRLAERTLASIRAIEWNHREVDPNASIGISSADTAAREDARVLLRQAEEAAEHARTGDKFGYEIYDPQHHEALVEALRFERTLRDAFAHGEFALHYQPERDAEAGKWVAAEALLRWRRPDGMTSASKFIGVIESSGLILSVGPWVMEQACADAMSWPTDSDGQGPSLRINVSARQFDEAGFVESVACALAKSGLLPSRLCLEVTETTLMQDIEHASRSLSDIHALGVRVAIDDFGTGYASLVYLKRLPVDVLKIDQSFVQGIPGGLSDTAIVRAVVGLGTSLDIAVVAEGVERQAQVDALRTLGVRYMQGWLFAKAMDQESICRLLMTSP